MAPNTQVIAQSELPVLRESAVEELKVSPEASLDNQTSEAPADVLFTDFSYIPTPPPLPSLVTNKKRFVKKPELEAAQKKDVEQRMRTDRAKGWYDYEICFCDPYNAEIDPYLISEDMLPLVSEMASYRDDRDLWNEVPSSKTTGDTSSTSVVRLTSPPPSFGRMPNRWGYDSKMKLSDAVVLFPTESNTPADQLDGLRTSLQRGVQAYRPWEVREPIPVMQSKLKPVVFLLPTNTRTGYESRISPLVETRRKEIMELQKQGEDVLFIEADFTNRKEMQDALIQMVDYLRSNRGIDPAKSNAPPRSRQFSRMPWSSSKKTTSASASTTPKTESKWLFNWKLPSFFS